MPGRDEPTHRAYQVVKRKGQDPYWNNIGVAFTNSDGKGFTVYLQALPAPIVNDEGQAVYKIVLREPQDDDEGERGRDESRADTRRQNQGGSRNHRGQDQTGRSNRRR